MAESRRGSSWGEALEVITYLFAIGVTAFVLTRPDSSLGSWWSERRARIEAADAITHAWPELVAEGARLGVVDAERVLVEFADYECPYCRAGHLWMKRFLSENPDLTVVYRHLPIDQLHPMATPAAKAAICAEEGGSFDQVHNFLYESEVWRSEVDWRDIALEVGVSDLEGFIACLSSEETQERLDRDLKLARDLGLTGTPTFVGPAGVHLGGLTKEAVEQLLGDGGGV